MRQLADKLWFAVATAVCNLMVWGMFTVLNVPHVDVAAYVPERYIPKAKFVATTGVPVRIMIPDLGMNLPVSPGSFDPNTQEWTLSDDSAYYATFSVPVNDSNGTTLIYGHATPGMFEPLNRLDAGTKIDVHTDNEKVFTYSFAGMREVDPRDTSVLTDVGPPLLVLQTCSGPWDIYRALYQFNFEQVRLV